MIHNGRGAVVSCDYCDHSVELAPGQDPVSVMHRDGWKFNPANSSHVEHWHQCLGCQRLYEGTGTAPNDNGRGQAGYASDCNSEGSGFDSRPVVQKAKAALIWFASSTGRYRKR